MVEGGGCIVKMMSIEEGERCEAVEVVSFCLCVCVCVKRSRFFLRVLLTLFTINNW